MMRLFSDCIDGFVYRRRSLRDGRYLSFRMIPTCDGHGRQKNELYDFTFLSAELVNAIPTIFQGSLLGQPISINFIIISFNRSHVSLFVQRQRSVHRLASLIKLLEH